MKALKAIIAWFRSRSATGYAYRGLEMGEIVRATDEYLDDRNGWGPTRCFGHAAPDPSYTSHRQYRRRVGADTHTKKLTD